MKGIHQYLGWLLILLLITACKEEERAYYPSVKLELVTVKAGDDGRLQLLIPDKAEALAIVEDRTHSSINPGMLRRVLSNYEEVLAGDGRMAARIYSLQSVVTSEPKKENDLAFVEGVKTDPVEVIGIWLGGGYLNMILNIKVKGRKQHVLGIIEESVEEKAAERVATLSLHHDAKGDEEYYNRRAYISVSLAKYGSDKPITVRFKYHMYDKNGANVESEKYCNPGFQYLPDVN